MKNQENRNQLKLVNILWATALLMSTVAYAEEGRNGPHLTGIAVPPRADRSFDPNDLIKATNRCATIQLKSFYQQYFKRPWDLKAEYQWALPTASIQQNNFSRQLEVDGKPHYLHATFSATLVNPKGSKIEYKFDLDNFDQFGVRSVIAIELAEGDLPQVVDRRPLLTVFGGVPAFYYEHTIENPKYDEYGQLTSFKEGLKNLKIGVHPTHGESMPYYSVIRDGGSGTLRGPTGATFNGVEYANCLLGDLQK